MNNRVLGIALLLVSFINFYAGLSGLLAVLIAVLIAHWLNFDKASLKSGLYSFNALITGIGLGTFFDPGMVFFVLLALSSLLTLLISIAMGGWLGKNGLPYLSIPFVLSFWMILLPSSLYENLGLTQRNIFWINEAYALGGNPLVQIFEQIESWELQHLLDIYLRSLSSVIFQNNLLVGIVIAVALLISSRIFFSLSLLGFLSAYIFAQFVGTEAASITYYDDCHSHRRFFCYSFQIVLFVEYTFGTSQLYCTGIFRKIVCLLSIACVFFTLRHCDNYLYSVLTATQFKQQNGIDTYSALFSRNKSLCLSE
jgi:hypothetical protein